MIYIVLEVNFVLKRQNFPKMLIRSTRSLAGNLTKKTGDIKNI